MPTPSRQRRDGEDFSPAAIRGDILEAATEVFSVRGYHATSMQDVADALGMRKPSLYHHVRKKEDLLYAIHDRLIDGLVAQTVAAVSTGEPSALRLRAVLRVAMDLVANHTREVRVFLSDADAIEGERWDAIVAKRDDYERMVRGVLEEGVADGSFVIAHVPVATRGILAMANWGYTWFDPAGELSAGAVADLFADMTLHGIATR
ncbi:MAG: TetR/AcrR family transcriptional regulator [Solirubrobacterales bacterium]|nr:TetR/AcrR family transcriptional regulator [Solirubrobacterales bacterium]